MDKKFNPFYDSDFLISHEGSDERRMLVELFPDELEQLRDEIDVVLKGFGTNKESSRGGSPAVELEIKKPSGERSDEMFYLYSIGDFRLWFVQNVEDGNIYSVGLREQGDELQDFEINVFANEEKHGGYYPNQFQIRPRSYSMSTADAKEFFVKMEKACKVLDAVEVFFERSAHRELYDKAHERNAQTRLVEHPYGSDLISRSTVMEKVFAHFERQGVSWDALDDDCKAAWGIIANFEPHAGDLVSREGLLDAVLDRFGCDLAYLGEDLQVFQDVIIGVLGVDSISKGALDEVRSGESVDDLISDACQRGRLDDNGKDIENDYMKD